MSTILKRAALLTGSLVVLLIAVLLIRAIPPSAPPKPPTPTPPALPAQAADRLAESIRFATISHVDPTQHPAEAFEGLHRFLEIAFPKVHGQLRREVINRFSLVYTWPGRDPSLEPILLLGHMDVVPVDPATLKDWSAPPFDGVIKDGFIWGRGALDDKVCVLGILEAIEHLIAQNFEPTRTVILGFGHDEEISGRDGAKAIAAHLSARGVKAAFALDEGHAIVKGIMPGVQDPVALIGLAEKGFASVELVVKGTGGHSSMPPKHTAAGILAQAITRLETHQVPARIEGPLRLMFEAVGPHMSFTNRLAMANLWLLEPVVIKQLEAAPSTNAALRTTTAVTQLEGSPQDNILPQRARAVVNFRIRPGDTMESVLAHVNAVIDDPRVEASFKKDSFNSDPSPVSSSQSAGFEAITRSITKVWPTTITAPAASIAATDGRHYASVARDVYRFAPIILTSEDTVRLHGLDERISVQDYLDAIRFYIFLIQDAAGQP